MRVKDDPWQPVVKIQQAALYFYHGLLSDPYYSSS
jgi:hypothetical protein